MATWDEIRGLAADLQRVQLASAKQRLTERNCIEIVQRLTQMGLIKLVYTCDGKCFLTEAELAKEIAEELELRQHRVNVVTLQEVLNIDLTTVEHRVRELVKSDPQLHLINGELMHDAYFRRVAHEINEALYERGHVTLGELTIAHNLSTQTVLSIVRQHLGTVIQGSLDSEDALFTDRYLRRHRARVRGYFNGAVKPLTVQQAAGHLRMPERLLRTVLEELQSAGDLKGSFQGGKSTYVPVCFSKAHDEWARGFYAQNQYIELEAVKKCGLVADPKPYLRRLLADRGEPLLLKTCFVSPDVVASLEAALDGARWLDVALAVTVPLSDADTDALLGPLLASRPDLVQVAGHYVLSRKWLAELRQSFDQFLNERAEALVKADPSLLSGSSDLRHRRQQQDEPDDDAGGGTVSSGPVGKIKSGSFGICLR